MKLIFTGYTSSPGFSQPAIWLKRINGYTGILESLARDHEVTGIERINYTGVLDQKGVKYYFIRWKNKQPRFPTGMHRLIKRLQPDIVFVNGFNFPLQIIQLRLGLGKRVKIVVMHRAEKPFKGFKKYLQKLADRCVNAYLFVSAEFGDVWIANGNIANPQKIHELLHGSSVFTADASITKNAGNDPAIFLWVGRLEANKDPITVVKGFISFLGIQPGARLYMIYQSEELLPAINQLIQQNAIASSAIRLVGKVEHDNLQDWYNKAGFIISGSHYEGGGIAVCEAMSCGCIPVVTNIISFRKMTGPGKCGLLYEAGDDKALLAALTQTTKMDTAREREATITQFRQEFSFDAIANKINKVIRTL